MLNRLLNINNLNNYSDAIDNEFFNTLFRNENVPPANIKEDDKGFEIELAAPGFDKADFNVNVDKDILSISAKRSAENVDNQSTDKKPKINYCRREYAVAQFKRTFTLPSNIDRENISGDYINGILKLTLPKAAATVSRAITIR